MQIKTTQIHVPQKKVAIVMFFTLIALVFTYLFLVNQTILHVVQRKQLTVEKSALESKISGLEFTYMRSKNTITTNNALASGFKEAEKVTYIHRTPESSVLTLNR